MADVADHVHEWRFDHMRDLWFCQTCAVEITDEELAHWINDADTDA